MGISLPFLSNIYLASTCHISLGSECLPNHSVSASRMQKFLPPRVSSFISPTAVTTFTPVTPAVKSKNHFLEATTWVSCSPGFSYPTSTSTVPHRGALCTIVFYLRFPLGWKKKSLLFEKSLKPLAQAASKCSLNGCDKNT